MKQALCTAKLHMKIAECFRTRGGAEHFAHMRGLVETARKRKWNLRDCLRPDPNAAPPQPHPVPS